jgi:uncharacterized paraquat-inducible protein A
VKCEECLTLWGYEEKDLWISTNKGHNIFNCEDFTLIEKHFECPRCHTKIIVSRDEKKP